MLEMLLGLAFLTAGSAIWLRASGRLRVGAVPPLTAGLLLGRVVAGVFSFIGLLLVYSGFF